jgi:glycosyltransferase involved in cell wall biosynthesis
MRHPESISADFKPPVLSDNRHMIRLSRQQIKILHCIPNMNGGGAERQLTYLCKGLVSKGLDVHVALCGGGRNMERLNDCGAAIHKLSAANNYDPRILWQLIGLIREIRPDIIQTWLRQMDVFGGIASAITSVPLVLAERNGKMAYGRRWKDMLRVAMGKRASGIIANSGDGRQYWQQRTSQHVLKRTIRNAVPFEEIENSSHTDVQTGLGPATKLIVSAASFKPQKNLGTLLEAFEIVMRGSKDAAAVLFGDGPLRDELIRIRDRLGLTDRVRIMGFTSRLCAWLARADVFVSVSYFEGSPNTVLEAIACKCPLVVSDVPAHRELLDDSAALFATPTSRNDIADKIGYALSNKRQMRRNAAVAYIDILKLSPETITQQYIDTYREIIKSKRA